MNIDQLKYFLKVAEVGHMTHAAEELNISEPALSKSIVRLEEELGISLFDRVGRSIQLNNKGKELVPYVEDALKMLDSGLQVIHEIEDTEESHIKLQTMPLVIFPGLFDLVLESFPNAVILNSRETPAALADNLLTGKSDLCLTSRELSHVNIAHKVVYTEPVFFVAPPDHPLANRKRVHAADLLNEKLISAWRFSTLAFNMEKVFADYPDAPKETLTVSSLNEALEYISRSLCVSIMSKSVYADLSKRDDYNLRLIPIYDADDKPITSSYTLHWHKKRHSKTVAALKKLIADYFTNTYDK